MDEEVNLEDACNVRHIFKNSHPLKKKKTCSESGAASFLCVYTVGVCLKGKGCN